MPRIVLIVDSSESDAGHLARLVAQALPGATSLSATSGGHAFDLLAEQRVIPSIIMAEFALPDMHGIQFLGRLRQERWLEGVPVAMVSNAASDRDMVSCYRLGVKAFLAKPARLLDVRETLRDFSREAHVLSSASVVSATPATTSHPAAA